MASICSYTALLAQFGEKRQQFTKSWRAHSFLWALYIGSIMLCTWRYVANYSFTSTLSAYFLENLRLHMWVVPSDGEVAFGWSDQVYMKFESQELTPVHIAKLNKDADPIEYFGSLAVMSDLLQSMSWLVRLSMVCAIHHEIVHLFVLVDRL